MGQCTSRPRLIVETIDRYADGSFTCSLIDGVGCQVGEQFENTPGSLGLAIIQKLDRLPQRGNTPIGDCLALGTIDAIEKSREIDQAGTMLKEITVDDLLA